MNNWFEINRDGLAKLIEDRPKIFIINELASNCWDEDSVTEVNITLTPIAGRPQATLEVTDNSPNGFQRLSDAWTMFAESYKKGEVEKRGRFNLGEKLVLALCEQASIISTKGSVHFTAQGRVLGKQRRDKGTWFTARVRMTRDEYDQVCQDVIKMISPPGITTTFNGQALPAHKLVTGFDAILPTIVAFEDGVLRRTTRKTRVHVYEPIGSEPGWVYEMGIPVVETGDRYDVNVEQKIPLNSDRNNVTPAFLRALRVEVVNHTAHLMDEQRAASTEVKEATSDPRCEPVAVEAMLDKQFGKERFTFDPSDPEANSKLMAAGYTPIKGGSLSAEQWGNVKKYELSTPAGVLRPTPKPYAAGGRPENEVPPDKWTAGMRELVDFCQRAAPHLIGKPITARISNEPISWWAANYGQGTLTFNLGKLGHKFFNDFPWNMEWALDLLIHELGHEYSGNHLSEDYYDGLTRIGAKAAMLALQQPDLFQVDRIINRDNR